MRTLHKNADNLIGRRFGKVIVMDLLPQRYHHSPVWLCICDCGKSKVFHSGYLRRRVNGPLPVSCGCARFTVNSYRVCLICKKLFFSKWRSRDKRYQQTCSRSCAVKNRDFIADKNPNWKNNSTIKNLSERLTSRYKKWRLAVLSRDGNHCIQCGESKNLTVDHIKPWAFFPDLRYELSNGRTLCRPCHLQTDTWGARYASS